MSLVSSYLPTHTTLSPPSHQFVSSGLSPDYLQPNLRLNKPYDGYGIPGSVPSSHNGCQDPHQEFWSDTDSLQIHVTPTVSHQTAPEMPDRRPDGWSYTDTAPNDSTYRDPPTEDGSKTGANKKISGKDDISEASNVERVFRQWAKERMYRYAFNKAWDGIQSAWSSRDSESEFHVPDWNAAWNTVKSAEIQAAEWMGTTPIGALLYTGIAVGGTVWLGKRLYQSVYPTSEKVSQQVQEDHNKSRRDGNRRSTTGHTS